jgi:hypothetical protein
MRSWILLALAAPTSAGGAPITLQHQGRLLNAAGAPLEDPVTLRISVHPDGGTSAALWSEDFPVDPEGGHFTVTLGANTAGNPLQDTVFSGSARYLQFATVTGGVPTTLGPRQLVGTVPNAVHATNLAGGAVSATSVVAPTVQATTSVRLGSDARTCTDGAAAGTVRFSTTASRLEFCDGSQWTTLAVNRPASCAEIKQRDPLAISGQYTVDPGGLGDLSVWCDMSSGEGWTLLMRIAGTSRQHVDNNNRNGAYPCLPSSTDCKLATADINRFIAAAGVNVLRIVPDSSSYIPWYVRAASDLEQWPLNLDCSNRPSLASTSAWAWILTSYQTLPGATAGTGGDTGDYTGSNHHYPTPYGPEQIFFKGSDFGLRANNAWDTTGTDNVAGTLWIR